MDNFSAAFKVINERNCPFYSLGDWFVLNNQAVRVPAGLPSCLILVREFTNILFSLAPETEDGLSEKRNEVFSCGGCTGLIKFQVDDLPENGEKLSEKSKPGTEGDKVKAGSRGKSRKSGVMVSGSLEGISPSELLQFFHMHQKTGKLLLDVPTGTARVAFREGAIIGARYQEKEDREAIYRILGEKKGKFSFVSGIPESLMEVDDIGDFMMVLMDGLKRLDEAGAGKE
jgi:uncharacterized repeat protein (TIGR04076 family)